MAQDPAEWEVEGGSHEERAAPVTPGEACDPPPCPAPGLAFPKGLLPSLISWT